MKVKIKYLSIVIFLILGIRLCYSCFYDKEYFIKKDLLKNTNVLEIKSIESNQSNHERFRVKLITKNNIKVILEEVDKKNNDLIFGNITRIENYGTARELLYTSYEKYESINVSYSSIVDLDLFNKIFEKNSVSQLLENLTELKVYLSNYPVINTDFYEILENKPEFAAKKINPEFEKTNYGMESSCSVGYYIHNADEFCWSQW